MFRCLVNAIWSYPMHTFSFGGNIERQKARAIRDCFAMPALINCLKPNLYIHIYNIHCGHWWLGFHISTNTRNLERSRSNFGFLFTIIYMNIICIYILVVLTGHAAHFAGMIVIAEVGVIVVVIALYRRRWSDAQRRLFDDIIVLFAVQFSAVAQREFIAFWDQVIQKKNALF